MAKIKVTVLQQASEPIEILTDDSKFNLKSDWFDYINGEKTGANGNSVGGAMVGDSAYFRFPDVISIHVDHLDEEGGKVNASTYRA